MRRVLFFIAVSALSGPLAGCGSAVFYDTVTVREGCDAPAPLPAAAPPPERAVEVVRDDGFRDSLRQMIKEPRSGACTEDLRELRVQVASAIDLAVANRDWPRERCLSVTGQTLGTLYHASAGVPFVDQEGRIMTIEAQCPAVEMARMAQACTI